MLPYLNRISDTNDTKELPHISEYGSQHRSCLPGTRVGILKDISDWASAQDPKSPIYCIRDVAGTGKSTIAKSVLDEWDQSIPLSFFFSQKGNSCGNASDLCFCIKEQIEEHYTDSELEEYWKTLPPLTLKRLRGQAIDLQWKQLVFQPLEQLKRGKTYLLVIDSLDECTVDTRDPLVRCLLDACLSGFLSHVRVLITTRDEEDIRLILDHESYRGLIQFKALLHANNTNADIELYVNHRLAKDGLFIDAPKQRKSLVTRCGGLFIFASLACTLLFQIGPGDAPLDKVLERFTSLDALYHQALRQADKSPEFTRRTLKKILSIILVAKEPLSIMDIATLLSIRTEEVEWRIRKLGSVLAHGGIHEPVFVLHATFTEFLVRQTWVTTSTNKSTNEYAISRPQSNRLMAECCLSTLLRDLRDNMYQPRPDDGSGQSREIHNVIMPENSRLHNPSAAVRYAASTWIAHSLPELHIERVVEDLRKVFLQKILNWVELGAIGDKLGEYAGSMNLLRTDMEKYLKLANCVLVRSVSIYPTELTEC